MKTSKADIDAAWERARAEIGAHNERLENDPAFRAERKAAIDRSNAQLAALLASIAKKRSK
jgi:hypothetical protein